MIAFPRSPTPYYWCFGSVFPEVEGLAALRLAPPSSVLGTEVVEKFRLTAEELIYGPEAAGVSLSRKSRDGRLAPETRRLVLLAERLHVEGLSKEQAYISVRDRELPNPTSNLLLLPGEFPSDLWEPNPRGPGAPRAAGFVEHILSKALFASPIDTFSSSSYELLRYVDGVYLPGAKAYVHAEVERAHKSLGRTARNAFAEEVARAVARRTMVSRDRFNPAGQLNLANGVLDVITGRLSPHTPALRFTHQLPISFDAAARCPAFDAFMAEVLPEEADRREIRKLFGYCLLPGNALQLAFMFVGDGCNGKSTLLGVLVDLLGPENVSAETLQTLVANRFAAARLWGKRANICADIPANPVEFTGAFKLLTGGDQVRGEHKFAQPFEFVNGAKLIFSANVLPEVSDRTVAFWRRWIIFRFAQSFIGREDRDLPRRLRLELSGILNFALEGLADLAADGGFRSTRTTEALALEWKQRADPVFWFVNARVERDPGGWISKSDLYEAYTQFCETRGCSYRRLEVFGKLLPTYAPWTRTERRSVLGKPVHGWSGIRLRPETKEGEPALPDQPDNPRSDLPGWAGKAGSSNLPPDAARAGADPEDIFRGRDTRTDRARRSLGEVSG